MNSASLSLEQTNQFSKIFLDYINEDVNLEKFYGNKPSIESFEKQIQSKKFESDKRENLVSALHSQYNGYALTELQQNNIEKLLLPETFTITTGHQLSLATGPLYFIYKILTTIRLSEELKEKYTTNHFVPVFWMATEDHDIAEINHFHLFGKKYEWSTSQTGAAGRLSTAGLKELFAQIPDCPAWLSAIYSESQSLSEATRKVVQTLFSQYGLLVLDADDKNLKSLFSHIMSKDIIDNKYAPLVKKTSDELSDAGYKVQAFVRDINFFYLGEQSRERIEKSADSYKVLNSSKEFSRLEIDEEIKNNPQNFSPNVILRPLYQEMLLPNLAYIGGPGELAYWFQLKSVFDSENIPFPILFPRKFITVASKSLVDKLQSADISYEDLFLNEKDFFELIIQKLQVVKFDFDKEEALLNEIRILLQQKASVADKSFFPAIEAEISRSSKGISDLGKRLNKAMENRHETELNKLQNLRKKLFPNNELQERHDNFLNFYINNPGFIDDMYAKIHPFDFKMDVIIA